MTDVAELEVTSFSINDTQYPFELAKHSAINKGDLNSEFAEHSHVFAFYATAYELAKAHQEHCKVLLDRAYAQADVNIRNAAKGAEMKMTEKMVENMVLLQQPYQDAQTAYMDACLNAGLLKASVSTMEAKKDMLISLGAMMRAEGDSTISINKKMENAKKIMAGHV
jgi:hypothetical protein